MEDVIVWVFGWVVWAVFMGFLGTLLGGQRGQAAAGRWLGILLGPIGLLLILLLGPGDGYGCRHCGGIIVPGAERCRHCGQSLRLTRPKQATSTLRKKAAAIDTPCPHCMAPIPTDDLILGTNTCPSCGADFAVK